MGVQISPPDFPGFPYHFSGNRRPHASYPSLKKSVNIPNQSADKIIAVVKDRSKRRSVVGNSTVDPEASCRDSKLPRFTVPGHIPKWRGL